MKLLILTQYYPPEMGAPQARLHELATRLRKKGHHITILTGMPNYPTGKIYPEYKGKVMGVEQHDGCRVIRTWLYPSKSSKISLRMISYLSFALMSLFFGLWRIGKQDIVLVESPPLFLTPTGWFLSRVARAKALMMVSDIWPDIIVRMGSVSGGWSLKLMYWLEKWAYCHYDVVALTNPGAKRQITSRFPEVKTAVISNGVDTTLFSPKFRSEVIRKTLGAKDRTFLVGYCGLHGLAQGLEAVIEAAKYIQYEQHIKFILMGDGPVKKNLVKLKQQKQIRNLFFYDQKPKSEMPAIVSSCDIMIVPLSTRLPGTMPSKIYEALASGTPPIVAKGCEGEKLLTTYQAGMTYEPMDGEELAEKVKKLVFDPQLYKEIRQNAIKISKRFDRDLIAQRTEILLKAVNESHTLPIVEW